MNENAIQDLIIEAVKSFKGHSVRRRELYNRLALKKLEYPDFKRILDDMEKVGSVVRVRGHQYELPGESGIIKGVFRTVPSGGGVVTDKTGDPVFVSHDDTRDALTGDVVMARLLRRSRPGYSRSARVVKIFKRTTRPVVGIFKRYRDTAFVVPREEGVLGNMIVQPGAELDAKEGDMVLARMEPSTGGFSRPMCVIAEVMGDPDAPGMDVLAIARRYQLPTRFPEEVLTESEALSGEITPDIIAHRRDIRDTLTVTIDPVDAKDFDDAISIFRRDDGGFELGVHIADVAHYVAENSPVDLEARSRGMSCYLVDRVLPMLPERLSNDLCSLKPNVARLTKSVFATLDSTGKLLSSEVAHTIIRSDMRLHYGQVQAYLDGVQSDETAAITPEIGAMLKTLSDLTGLLIAQRKERGALDFELPEALVILDGNGRPVDIQKRGRFLAHQMVEEAMILANVVTASALGGTRGKFLYRVHERPDYEKLEAFEESALSLGYEFHISLAEDHQYLRDFLLEVRGGPHERVLNILLLRSMKKAVYSPHNKGHFGLALPVYAHFTSPIRRYPDLLLHRQLDKFLPGSDGGEEITETPVTATAIDGMEESGGGKDYSSTIRPEHEHGEQSKGSDEEESVAETASDGTTSKRLKDHKITFYENLGAEITEREILTDNAERDSIKMKAAEFMVQHLGDEFDATISGILPIGFFVELDPFFVEGLVHVSTIGNDYYEIDSPGISLAGRNTGMRFMVGDRVRVQVIRADKERGQVDFILVGRIGEEGDAREWGKTGDGKKAGKPQTGGRRPEGAGKRRGGGSGGRKGKGKYGRGRRTGR